MAAAIWAAPAQGYSTVTGTAGNTGSAIASFISIVGGADNGGSPGSRASGYRRINWDDIPDSYATPNKVPVGYYNLNSPRGMVITSPGGPEVSASSGPGVNFASYNPTYTFWLTPYSQPRALGPVGNNLVEVSFFVPGTNVHAAVSSFGAVFVNHEVYGMTSVELFDQAGNVIAKLLPFAGGKNEPAFIGVYGLAPGATRARITLGNSPLGPMDEPPTTNVVLLDDLIYGEPQALPSPSLTVQPTPDTTSSPSLSMTGTVSDSAGIANVSINGRPVTIAPNGSWAMQLNLAPGPNNLEVTALSTNGNSTVVRRTVTYAQPAAPTPAAPSGPHCHVPKLLGKSLQQVRKRLLKARCVLGKVKHKQSKRRPGRVIGQSPKAGTVLADHAAVGITLARH